MNRTIPARTVALLSADLAVLIGLRHSVVIFLDGVSAPHAWIAEVGVDAAVAQACVGLIWCAGAWLAIALAAATVSSVPGAIGRCARATLARLAPSMLARLLAGATGLTMALGSTAASADVIPKAPTVPISASAGSAALPAPVLPTTTDHRRPVVVRPRDTLWAIAAARLGPTAASADVARATARWYAANRSTIGPDANLIHPGQRLLPPSPPEQP